MKLLSDEKANIRQRTLLISLLLSMWGPLATGLAVAMSRSSTQVADFVRRTVELVALFISWFTFRYVCQHEMTPARRARFERTVGWSVVIALGCSGIVMLIIALQRLTTAFQPGGNVYPGLLIATLGAITNGWFWRRYAQLNVEQPDMIIEAQWRLYRAKTFVDFCVMAALGSVALFPAHPISRYVDLLGTLVVAGYLMWSSLGSAQGLLKGERVQAASKIE